MQVNLDDGHLVGEPGDEMSAMGKKARIVAVTQSLDFTGAQAERSGLLGTHVSEPGQSISSMHGGCMAPLLSPPSSTCVRSARCVRS